MISLTGNRSDIGKQSKLPWAKTHSPSLRGWNKSQGPYHLEVRAGGSYDGTVICTVKYKGKTSHLVQMWYSPSPSEGLRAGLQLLEDLNYCAVVIEYDKNEKFENTEYAAG